MRTIRERRSAPIHSLLLVPRSGAHGSRSGRARTALVAAIVALLASAAPARAQNLVPNGRFDDDIVPFAPVGVDPAVASHDAVVDRGGPTGSGSLKLVNTGSAANVINAGTCISQPIPEGGYYFDYWVRFATGEAANGSAQVAFRGYASSDCSGTPLVSFYGTGVGPVIGRGLWVQLDGGDVTTPAGTVPAGVNSLRAAATLSRTTAGTLTANFDAFFFAPVGKPLCGGLVPTIGGKDIDDVIVGTSGADVIVAFGGDDTVFAGAGSDFVCGGGGDDTLHGEENGDALFGQGGDDTLFGDDGNDVVKGGPGDDTLSGGTGTKDVCNGGGGTDTADVACEKQRRIP